MPKLGLNFGSGQRRFTTIPGVIEWTNADVVSRTGQVPDVVVEGAFPDHWASSFDCVVLWHVIEHFGCGEADRLLQDCNRSLATGGELILAIPDMKALAQRWLMGKIDDYIFAVNTYGAFQGEEGDRHRWLYTKETLVKTLRSCGEWSTIEFSFTQPPGSDIQSDWWMLTATAVKG